jgi:1-acyl-sn-glycerol-3-phosphate acyltransferase
MTRTRIACVLRRWLWRVVCAVSGGLTVTGRWRVSGGCVVVANHSSHADTAVLLAALPAAARPVFVAAADYWFDVPVRRFVVASLAGALPVRRSGGGTYAALVAAARPALKAGRTVVIYPEGTRSTNGNVAEFRSGALRLARDCGVPVVPVAVVGTAEVLPKHGRFSPAPMQVRIGEPVDPESSSAPQLRARVIALRQGCLPEGSRDFAHAAAASLDLCLTSRGRPVVSDGCRVCTAESAPLHGHRGSQQFSFQSDTPNKNDFFRLRPKNTRSPR